MTDAEFRQWLTDEVNSGRMDLFQREDLLHQKQLFDNERSRIKRRYRGLVVGYAADQQFVGRTVRDLVDQVKRDRPQRLVYFEPVCSDHIILA